MKEKVGCCENNNNNKKMQKGFYIETGDTDKKGDFSPGCCLGGNRVSESDGEEGFGFDYAFRVWLGFRMLGFGWRRV